MPGVDSYKYLFTLRYDFSGWIKSKLLRELTRPTIIKFLKKEILLKYRIFILLVIDKRLKNKKLLIILIEKYRINKIIVFIYYF